MASRNAEILCIGTELLMGDIVNTNAAFIARELTHLGISVYHQSVVGDNPQRLMDSLTLAFSRADIVITTGGLGPTYDDLSKETIASYFHRDLVLDEASLAQMQRVFQMRHAADHPAHLTESHYKQAMMPRGAIIFPNSNGTAPGCAIEGENGKTAIMLPGPPNEMTAMFRQSVIPYLLRDSDSVLVSHNLHFYGIGELNLERELRELMQKSTNPTIAPYAKTGEVLLRVTAKAPDEAAAEKMIAPVIEEIRAVAGEYLYGIDVGDLQTAAVRALAERQFTVATAESCTGGLVSKRLTEVPGASAVFECGICSYSNRIKHQVLSVSEETLKEHTAISPETALEMAKQVRLLAGADIGVSVTGNAGPAESEGKPVGTVFLAVSSDWHTEVVPLDFYQRGGADQRKNIRYLASSRALSLILQAAKLHP